MIYTEKDIPSSFVGESKKAAFAYTKAKSISPEESHGRLPNFVVVGAQKAGSSSLYNYLAGHPEIFLPTNKELHYFDDAFLIKTMSLYQAQFVNSHGFKRRGECTPAYLSYPGAAEKIRRTLGDIPIIVIVREPVSRMYSQYWHASKYGYETHSFREGLRLEGHRKKRLGLEFFRKFDYVGRSTYASHIDKYRALFSNVLVCRLEDLASDASSVLATVFNFLNVSSLETVAARSPSNPSQIARSKLVNQGLNYIESKMGATHMTRFVRRRNFKSWSYPAMTQEDRQLALEALHNACPETLNMYSLYASVGKRDQPSG